MRNNPGDIKTRVHRISKWTVKEREKDCRCRVGHNDNIESTEQEPVVLELSGVQCGSYLGRGR